MALNDSEAQQRCGIKTQMLGFAMLSTNPPGLLPNKNGKISNTITRTPLPNSKKGYTKGTLYPDIAVPYRQVSLTNGKSIDLYDTSGPYTDSSVEINLEQGLAPIRREWILARQDTEESSLLPESLRVNYPQHQPRIS